MNCDAAAELVSLRFRPVAATRFCAAAAAAGGSGSQNPGSAKSCGLHRCGRVCGEWYSHIPRRSQHARRRCVPAATKLHSRHIAAHSVLASRALMSGHLTGSRSSGGHKHWEWVATDVRCNSLLHPARFPLPTRSGMAAVLRAVAAARRPRPPQPGTQRSRTPRARCAPPHSAPVPSELVYNQCVWFQAGATQP